MWQARTDESLKGALARFAATHPGEPTMTSKTLLLAAAAVVALAASLPTILAPATAAKGDRIIPRKDIFGNPTRTSPKLSPDGKHVAYIAPQNGVLNVWVAPTGDLAAAKVVTNDVKRGIREFFWARNNTHILYRQDNGGDENWRIYLADIATAKIVALSPEGKVQANIDTISIAKPNEILIALNDRDPQHHDLYRVNLQTGERTLAMKNESYAGFTADDALTVRFAVKQTPGGGFDTFKVAADGKVDAKPFFSVGPEDSLTTQTIGFDTAGATFYMLESRGRDKAALATLDLKTAQTTILTESPKADVQRFMAHPVTGKVQAVSAEYLRADWLAVDDAVKGDISFLNREAKGDWIVTSRSDDDQFWTVQIDRLVEPIAFWLYDRGAKRLSKLFTARPNLEGAPLSPMYAVEIKARDGLMLPSYVSLPRGSDANRDGKPEKPLPMVLYVHGGPWSRDSYGYNPTHQWLANRGYAVMSVNYRGSEGFGKGFIEKATHEFAGKMHDDLIDSVDWAVANGVAQKDKIAIMGGSYGGYATLVGMTFTPTTFACGVDIVGPSNLVTLIESFPAYWQPFMEPTWYKRVGDPRTPEGKKLLLERSPITKVDQIQRPLLIGQGANDPRVTRKESDQIVAAMKARKIPVTYAIYADEGHGFARPENRISFYAIADNFIGKCLGGRTEPIGADLKGAAVEVPEGVDDIQGLKAALAAK
jgi:dipeptidyl aminopeptidase/acylaminoacyl peptidase